MQPGVVAAGKGPTHAPQLVGQEHQLHICASGIDGLMGGGNSQASEMVSASGCH